MTLTWLGALLLPLLTGSWRFHQAVHDHLFLGPVSPGWQAHTHGPEQWVHDQQADSTVISLFRFPGEAGTRLPLAGEAAVLGPEPATPAPTWLIWSLQSRHLCPPTSFPPPPDRPPI